MTKGAKISRALVGVDFDKSSASALNVAGALAAVGDVNLTLFHATTFEAPTYFTAAQIDAVEAERAQNRNDAADRQHTPRPVRVIVEEGPPQDPDIHHGAPDRVQNADLIVLSVTGTHAQFGAIVQVLKKCLHPVLFVPCPARIVERSSS